ncbi:exocyst complex component SEC3A-like isoform X3 [Senna tora]|uniref:Exocyst complex component SEC3A-like isoform X3 n=1 Tax=Senna tora TaxID=362788 RepID=A0A834WER8_9FABA|nr:exocyst complex component SEC3A-like isoform X3 [Senna tora]
MFFHGKQNVGKNYCSQVVRQSLLLLKLYEEEFQYVLHGLGTMDLQGTRCGLLKTILHHFPMLIPMVNPMLTCSSNHRKKISSYGYIVGGAEAFSERLKKELQPLEVANVHAILESEPMIDEAQSFNLPTVSFLHQVCFQNFAGIEGMKFWVIYM